MVVIIKRTKKRLLLIAGFVLTGFISYVGGYLRDNYSKDGSLFFTTANADAPACNSATQYCCFPANVLISTPSGKIGIQNIRVGDLVYGFNIETGEMGTQKVLKTMCHGKNDKNTVFSPVIKMIHEKGELSVTENHWVYRKNNRDGDYADFDRAGMFQVGDYLTLEDGSEVKILKIVNQEETPDFVYNLEVEGVHTYCADGVRVHNSSGGVGCCGGGNCK